MIIKYLIGFPNKDLVRSIFYFTYFSPLLNYLPITVDTNQNGADFDKTLLFRHIILLIS